MHCDQRQRKHIPYMVKREHVRFNGTLEDRGVRRVFNGTGNRVHII